MQRLHLLITGLCPDFGTQTEAAVDGPSVPSLRTLLGRWRKLETTPDTGLSQRLAELFHLPATPDLPFAPLRLQYDGIDPGEAQWWCADPVHMQLMLDHLRLGGGSQLNIEPAESVALIASLNQHFQGDVEFIASSPTRWHARFARPVAAHTTALHQARGQSVSRCLPNGPDSGRLQGLMNEAQMLLHAHPVNHEREAKGLEQVNSVWFWGGGQRVAMPALPVRMLSDETTARALAQASSTPTGPLPMRFDAAAPGSADLLVVLDSLHPLACDGRIAAWQHELGLLEEAWFKPVLDAIRHGQLKRASIEFIGAHGIICELSRMDLFKLWKPALSLSDFCQNRMPPR